MYTVHDYSTRLDIQLKESARESEKEEREREREKLRDFFLACHANIFFS